MPNKTKYEESAGCALICIFLVSQFFMSIMAFILSACAWPPSRVFSGIQGIGDILGILGATLMWHIVSLWERLECFCLISILLKL